MPLNFMVDRAPGKSEQRSVTYGGRYGGALQSPRQNPRDGSGQPICRKSAGRCLRFARRHVASARFQPAGQIALD
jgi:hypothetical protein